MGSRREAGGEETRPLALTRRTVIGAASAKPASGMAAALFDDPVVAECRRWLDTGGEIERLQKRWGDIEGRLIKSRSHSPSDNDQVRAESARELIVIDARLDVLTAEQDRQLALVSGLSSTNVNGVFAKLCIAMKLVHPSDHPEAHRLLAGSLRDLSALSDDKDLDARA